MIPSQQLKRTRYNAYEIFLQGCYNWTLYQFIFGIILKINMIIFHRFNLGIRLTIYYMQYITFFYKYIFYCILFILCTLLFISSFFIKFISYKFDVQFIFHNRCKSLNNWTHKCVFLCKSPFRYGTSINLNSIIQPICQCRKWSFLLFIVHMSFKFLNRLCKLHLIENDQINSHHLFFPRQYFIE